MTFEQKFMISKTTLRTEISFGHKMPVSLRSTTSIFETRSMWESALYDNFSAVSFAIKYFSIINEYEGRSGMKNSKLHIWKIFVLHWSTPVLSC